LFSESFFKTYFISLAQVSWFQVGGLGLCNPNKPAINNGEVTVHLPSCNLPSRTRTLKIPSCSPQNTHTPLDHIQMSIKWCLEWRQVGCWISTRQIRSWQWKSWINQVHLKKKSILFLFFTNFGTFFHFISHIHFLGPILYHLTKSHDFKSVFWRSGIQNKQPLFTVYPLYIIALLFEICMTVFFNLCDCWYSVKLNTVSSYLVLHGKYSHVSSYFQISWKLAYISLTQWFFYL
jgi:hypothetical protein